MEPAACARFEELLGWSFHDETLLAQALAHRSWCAEHPEDASNERFEFLGDAVLGIVVTDHIFRTYPHHQEGELAKVRASVVNADVLAEVAAAIELGPCLRLGKGEDSSGGREKSSILADAMEAVIAAVYLDGGMEAAWDVVMRLFSERIVEAATGPGGDDYKTAPPGARRATLRPPAPLPGAGRRPGPRQALLRHRAARGRAVRLRRGRIQEAGRAGRGAGGVGTHLGRQRTDPERVGEPGCRNSLRSR